MITVHSIKINFHGGIVSPGDLYNILVAAGNHGIKNVSFGLRQQLLLEVESAEHFSLMKSLDELSVEFEPDNDYYPNIVSSYPAEDIFMNSTWLKEGAYKDIFDLLNYRHRLKINLCADNQSFTPFLTGNINWIASVAPHFWHLLVRFPKTNNIYEWDQLVYTNDVTAVSREVEEIIFKNPEKFIDNPVANGAELFKLIDKKKFNTQKAAAKIKLPVFNLPYYEGLNKYHDKYWLGIYRRDEKFSLDLLKDICLLSLETKLGQLCSTPWKSIIIKDIKEKHKPLWNRLLAKHNVNMRHAANELNFQVEDQSADALHLKNWLVKKLNDNDVRSFGLCVGVKTRKKSEVFSSILVKRKPIIKIGRFELGYVYDILCAKDFNPNERTGFVFSRNNPKFVLDEQLHRAILLFQKHVAANHVEEPKVKVNTEGPINKTVYVYLCSHCLSEYNEGFGDPAQNIEPGTSFEDLPNEYCCPLCEESKSTFQKRKKEPIISAQF